MNQEYRRELRQLERSKKKIDSDYKGFMKQVERERLSLDRQSIQARKRCNAMLQRIERRRAFLEGRLA